MTALDTKPSRTNYPFVTEPFGERWQILFVDTDWPYRVAEFDVHWRAVDHAKSLNNVWWADLHAFNAILRREERDREKPEPPLLLSAASSLWRWLKALLLPR